MSISRPAKIGKIRKNGVGKTQGEGLREQGMTRMRQDAKIAP